MESKHDCRDDRCSGPVTGNAVLGFSRFSNLAAQAQTGTRYRSGCSGPIPGGSSLNALDATSPIMAMMAKRAVQAAAISQAVPKMKNALA